MKIAVWHNLPSGGSKRALHYHVRGLAARGHTLESWCPLTADQSYLPLSELITEHIVPLSWQPRKSKAPIGRFLASYHNVIGEIKAMDQHCQRCAEEINHNRFDLLFANASMDFAVTPIGRYVKIPKVLYLPEPYRILYEARPTLPWVAFPAQDGGWRSPTYLKSLLADFARVHGLRVRAREELLNAQAFDAILVNSLFSRESILRVYNINAKVCYLGIDTELFANQHQPREDFIVGIGRFAPQKHIRFVVEALAHLMEPRPRLVWIGDRVIPSYLEEIKQVAKSVNVEFEPKVRINDRELVDILNRAMMMVYAPQLEPFGFAPLEANACGVPVIAVAEGGVRETIVNGVNGLLVEYDVKATARAIDYLRNNKDYARRLGENGCKIVTEKWTLNTSIDRLEQIFAEVTREH